MKKIFTLSIAAVMAALLFTSCRKEVVVVDDNSYWLSQEQGNVVYSSNYCGYYVVETNYGYTVIQNIDGLRTYAGDVMYGDFGRYGTRDFYNYTADVITLGKVMAYDLTYSEAQAAIDYYCPVGKANGQKITVSSSSQSKTARPASTEKK
jgi:hypothetical protein